MGYLQTLSWHDLEEWAGSTIVDRGKRYQKDGRVRDLVATPEGELIATVNGTHDYATLVQVRQDGNLGSVCTCPYGATCKHAVAVVLEALMLTKTGTEVPPGREDDDRMEFLRRVSEGELAAGFDDRDHTFEPSGPSDSSSGKELVKYLRSQKKQDLLKMLEHVVKAVPGVCGALDHWRRMAAGKPEELIDSARMIIGEVRTEDDWEDAWEDDDEVDYDSLKELFEALLELGRHDDVMALGAELLEAGNLRVEMSHEGDIAWDIQRCMGIVFQAAIDAPGTVVKRMIWVMEMESLDDYDLCSGSSLFWTQDFEKGDWSELADHLLLRLESQPAGSLENEFSAGFFRDQLGTRAVEALEKAGRDDEVIPLCEREARTNYSYLRLVKLLEQSGQREDAEKRILDGIAIMDANSRFDTWQLRDELEKLKEKSGDWAQLAALRAERFFADPELPRFNALLAAAAKARFESDVRTAALEFLETGKRARPGHAAWPLPKALVEGQLPAFEQKFPHQALLTDIAIQEDRPEAILHWYQQSRDSTLGRYWHESRHARVAEALRAMYPDEAIEIWKALAEKLVATVTVRNYQPACRYLQKIRMVLTKNGRTKEWHEYEQELRRQHARKRRFVEILGTVDGRPIIEG